MAGLPGKHSGSELEQKFITFTMGEEEYGIPVLQALEIVKIEDVIQVPHARDYLMGMMDIRGSVIPVIDLKKKLGIHLEANETVIDKAIIIRTGGHRIGLAVDRVSHVHHFPPDAIDAGPATIKSSTNRFITGVGKIKDDFVILLDLTNLFSSEEIAGILHRRKEGVG